MFALQKRRSSAGDRDKQWLNISDGLHFRTGSSTARHRRVEETLRRLLLDAPQFMARMPQDSGCGGQVMQGRHQSAGLCMPKSYTVRVLNYDGTGEWSQQPFRTVRMLILRRVADCHANHLRYSLTEGHRQ